MRSSEWNKASLVALVAAGLVSAGPVTTVPWNGHPGAASFTFDDACQSQLDNVVPALKARSIHATFFLYDVGGTFTNNKAKWVAAAKDGNELANHSVDHADFSKTIDATYQVGDMASRLRKSDPSVEAVTFAYPYCAIGYESAVGAENIIGRGCLFAAPYQPLQWKNPPSDWNNVGAIYVSDDANASGPTLTALDAAKSGGWISTLNHGVGGDWAVVSTANVLAMFDRAIANNLWVGTYQDVAAYWRAALVMDKVSATGAGPWTLSWTSPHAKMPKSVKLRVKLDVATFGNDVTVSQAGTEIPANSDGSYTVEFMKLGMTVAKKVASPGATFYQYANFGGLSAKLSEGSYTAAQLLAAGIPDNSIGSMKVDAGLTVSLYDGDNFVTTLGSYGADVADMATIGAGGKVTSLKIAKGSTVSVKSPGHTGAVRVRWSEGKLLLQGLEGGRMRLADLQGRSWDFRIAGGTASAAFLPTGVYRAWILDGADDMPLTVTVLR
jgi:peptidoglycan/xylan/chitin deacetylase (PgdA/CDA1 family)